MQSVRADAVIDTIWAGSARNQLDEIQTDKVPDASRNAPARPTGVDHMTREMFSIQKRRHYPKNGHRLLKSAHEMINLAGLAATSLHQP